MNCDSQESSVSFGVRDMPKNVYCTLSTASFLVLNKQLSVLKGLIHFWKILIEFIEPINSIKINK